jgi:hypothetical protein
VIAGNRPDLIVAGTSSRSRSRTSRAPNDRDSSLTLTARSGRPDAHLPKPPGPSSMQPEMSVANALGRIAELLLAQQPTGPDWSEDEAVRAIPESPVSAARKAGCLSP